MKRDVARALELLRDAADAGVADAQCCLGVEYEHASFDASEALVSMDTNEALHWYTLAAQLGHSTAAYNKARLEQARHMSAEAAESFASAAKGGHARALAGMATLKVREAAEAAAEREKAEKAGDAEKDRKKKGTKVDPALSAEQDFKAAALLDDAAGDCGLGVLAFRRGEMAQARAHWEQACSYGLYSYGPYRYCLCSYGRCSYGLFTPGIGARLARGGLQHLFLFLTTFRRAPTANAEGWIGIGRAASERSRRDASLGTFTDRRGSSAFAVGMLPRYRKTKGI